MTFLGHIDLLQVNEAILVARLDEKGLRNCITHQYHSVSVSFADPTCGCLLPLVAMWYLKVAKYPREY